MSREDWDKLPDFIPVYQAAASASAKINDKSFAVEFDADYTAPRIRLVKGTFKKDLYFHELNRLVETIAQHYNKLYINHHIATLKATRLTPVPVGFVDEIVKEANRELEHISKMKEEYAQL